MDHFTNRNDIFTYLIHLGYLAYDLNDETARIPNREIQSEWQRAIYLAYIYALNHYTIILELTTGRRKIAERSSHVGFSGKSHAAADAEPLGYADVVFIPFVPDKPAMIIELKRNSSTESALDQIRNKQYFDSLSHYQGDLLFVGVNYDEKEKTHSCKIERFTIS